MATCSAQELLTASQCFASMHPRVLEVLKVQLLCEILHAANPMASCDPQTLLNDSACFASLNAQQLSTIQTQLLCEILQGGGTGTTCIICGDNPPTDPAPCDCSLYYTNPPNAGVWVWDSSSAAWEMVLNPGA